MEYLVVKKDIANELEGEFLYDIHAEEQSADEEIAEEGVARRGDSKREVDPHREYHSMAEREESATEVGEGYSFELVISHSVTE